MDKKICFPEKVTVEGKFLEALMAQFEGLKKDVEKLRELESKISKIDSYVQSRVAADESFNNLISRFQNQIRNNNPSAPGGVRLVPLSDFINRSNTWPPPGI